MKARPGRGADDPAEPRGAAREKEARGEQGAQPAFDIFYRREFPQVVGLAFVLSGSRFGAEDIAQEAFMAAHRSWARISGYDDPAAWVRRVVANKCASAFRRRAAEARAVARLAVRRASVVPDPGPEAEEFWRLVRSLPRRQAQVVALHYFEDRSVADIAAVLGVGEGTVKRHLYDGRATLAKMLDLEAEG